MKKTYLVLLFVLTSMLMAGCGKTAKVDTLSIVPEPVFVNAKEGSFTFSNRTKIAFENIGQNCETAKYITKTMRQLHMRTSVGSTETDQCIAFSLNDSSNIELGEEGYILEVQNNVIHISANTETGLFYGFQTLLQMLPEDISNERYKKIVIPCCTILDYPRFEWRGSHLDVSRHFFTVKDVKKHLDLMAAYKLNKFHWHLTDDHGWRIEIEKYPLLNDVGSWRVDRADVPWGEAKPAKEGEECSYGGFYKKEEIKEIVEYAAQRHIDVIPEIEIPGHCSEILAAYPHFACANDDTTYQVQIGPYWPPRAILCGGNDSVMQFLFDVMDEIIPLFPYNYIHVGGDEAVKSNWERCPRCQARIKKLGLENENQLQSWMIMEVEAYLQMQGKQIIGWDEILDGGVSTEATVMSWQGFEGAVKAARHGNHAIMTPTEYCYLDYYQGNPKFCPPAMNHLLPLYKVYQFEPVPAGITTSQARFILGGQANLWAEYINDYHHAEYMLLPRLCAIAECLWSPADHKNWPRFRAKLVYQKNRLIQMGYNVFEGYFKPILFTSKNADGTMNVAFDWEVEGTEIYYSTEGTPEKDKGGIRFTEPFQVTPGTEVSTASYLNGELKEEIYTYTIEQQ